MKLPFNLGSKFAKGAFALKTISPELCVGGSILFGIACVVTSCVATMKSEPTVRDAEAKIEDIRLPHGVKEGETKEEALVPIKDLPKEDQTAIQAIRVNTALVVVKNYAVPAALGVASIVLNVHGNRILRRNLAAAATTIAGLTKSFDEYRQRVIADLGKEKDQEYMYGVKKRTEVEIDPDTGEVIGKKETYYKDAMGGLSPYARYFDEGDWDNEKKQWIHRNYVWRDDPFINQKNLRAIEREMNDKLVRDGYLFLNDVYKRLGLKQTQEGQVVGWDYNSANGDHAVCFGVFDDDPGQIPCNKAFLEGKTNVALLDFNVDGMILGNLESFFGKEFTYKLIAYNT